MKQYEVVYPQSTTKYSKKKLNIKEEKKETLLTPITFNILRIQRDKGSGAMNLCQIKFTSQNVISGKK